MKFMQSSWFKKYLVPGFIFQSVVIAGGYGTGREIVEFFLQYGPVGGMIAICTISFLMWAIVCAASFEFARVFKAYDYRSFFTKLLGKGWILFEICYIVLLLIVLAVCASSAGEILQQLFDFPYLVGVLLMMIGVGILVLKGKETIETVLSYWSFALYAVYIIFLVMTFANFSDRISAGFATGVAEPGYMVNGFKYAFYNLGIIPAVLFSVNTHETRKESILSGILAGAIGIIPGIILLVAMVGFYPEINRASLPINFILNALNNKALQYAFQIVLFGTLIETGTGFIFAVTERIKNTYVTTQREIPKWIIPAFTIGLLVLGVIIAQFGLISLIAKGYGTITWGFFIVFVIPILTLGVYKVAKAGK